MEAIFSPEAQAILDELEADPANDQLVDATWDVIDFITEHSGSNRARRRALRTVAGHSVWLAPIHGRYHDEVWVVLWQLREEDILIAYIGPEDFLPHR